MPDHFQLRGGSFFEIGAVYLPASGSVEHMRMLSDAATRGRPRPGTSPDMRPVPVRGPADLSGPIVSAFGATPTGLGECTRNCA
jgi:hypothetical protein